MSALLCNDVRMDLGMLRDLAAERSARWAASGLSCEVIDGPLTDKPASWLVLRATPVLEQGAVVGQLTVWVSGEAEMDWGTPDTGGERHYDLGSREDLSRCIDDLEAALRACP
jgi:hypothetical protein